MTFKLTPEEEQFWKAIEALKQEHAELLAMLDNLVNRRCFRVQREARALVERINRGT